MSADRLDQGFGELRGLLSRPVEGRWQARLAEELCGIYDADAGRFGDEVAPYVREALWRIAPGPVDVLSAVETAQVLERGAVAGLLWSLTLDGAYGEGPVLAWERLGPGALVRGVRLADKMPPRWAERVLRAPAARGLVWVDAEGGALGGWREGELAGLERLVVRGQCDAAAWRSVERGAPGLAALDTSQAWWPPGDAELGWLAHRPLVELACGDVRGAMARVMLAQLEGQTLRALRLRTVQAELRRMGRVCGQAVERLEVGHGYGDDGALTLVGQGRWASLKALTLRLGVRTSAAALRAALGGELPALESLTVCLEGAPSMGCWYMLWSAQGVAQLQGLRTLELRWSGGLREQLSVEELIDCVEAMRGLEQLRVEGVLWGKARRAQLVGTRAGALLGIAG